MTTKEDTKPDTTKAALKAQGKANLNAPGTAPAEKAPTPAATAVVSSAPATSSLVTSATVPALAGLNQRAADALALTRNILQEATELSQHTGPVPAGFGAKLRELSDTMHRAEKQAEAAKKLLRLASDLSKSRPQQA